MQGTNSRAARIAALIQRVIASNMESTLHDKRLKNVTITDVKVTNDLQLAKIYWTTLSRDGHEEGERKRAKEALNQLYRSKVEWHKKISLPVSIMIFFLIGAPLGAIIRKGGLGLPVVVSIIFFVIYYIISLSGEKLAKEGSWEAVYGIWLSTFILTPIAVYLTYKATNDSALLDTDWYAGRLKALNERMRPAINKLKNAIKLKRNGKKHDSE